MSSIEALTVTALGLAVVFSGLLLCFVCMKLLTRVAGRVTLPEPHGTVPGPAAAASAVPEGPVADDVLAVLVAVLEVERALYVGRYRSRLTLRRPAVTGETP